MALFSSDTKKTSSKPKAAKKAAPKKAAVKKTAVRGILPIDDARLANVLKAPWFSEKALIGTEKGVYVFEVPAAATKHDVANAIQKAYGVMPRKVNMVNLPAKKVSMRTRRGTGTRTRRHKAYVYLAAGDTIALA